MPLYRAPEIMLTTCRGPGCGREGPVDADWWILDVIAAAGSRGGVRTAAVPTRATGFLVCPQCQLTPWAAGLLEALNDPYREVIPEHTGCLITCINARRDFRIKMSKRWYARTGRIPNTTKCSICLGPAAVEFRNGLKRGRFDLLWDWIGHTAADHFAFLIPLPVFPQEMPYDPAELEYGMDLLEG